MLSSGDGKHLVGSMIIAGKSPTDRPAWRISLEVSINAGGSDVPETQQGNNLGSGLFDFTSKLTAEWQSGQGSMFLFGVPFAAAFRARAVLKAGSALYLPRLPVSLLISQDGTPLDGYTRPGVLPGQLVEFSVQMMFLLPGLHRLTVMPMAGGKFGAPVDQPIRITSLANAAINFIMSGVNAWRATQNQKPLSPKYTVSDAATNSWKLTTGDVTILELPDEDKASTVDAGETHMPGLPNLPVDLSLECSGSLSVASDGSIEAEASVGGGANFTSIGWGVKLDGSVTLGLEVSMTESVITAKELGVSVTARVDRYLGAMNPFSLKLGTTTLASLQIIAGVFGSLGGAWNFDFTDKPEFLGLPLHMRTKGNSVTGTLGIYGKLKADLFGCSAAGDVQATMAITFKTKDDGAFGVCTRL